MEKEFSIHYRNPGHWDISTHMRGRIFTIRGVPGRVLLNDERARPYPTVVFETVSAAVLWVADLLMAES